MTIRAAKTQATRAEYRRVYDNMDLPPRNIRCEHNGVRYERAAWSSPAAFGWDAWRTL